LSYVVNSVTFHPDKALSRPEARVSDLSRIGDPAAWHAAAADHQSRE
jgi:hypothetical protein